MATNPDTSIAAEPVQPDSAAAKPQSASFGHRLTRELLSWMWTLLAFLFITGTIVQARVIPSESMENTLLVGDHLLVSRLGYGVGFPFSATQIRLWREPHRQQMVVFHAPIPGTDEDFIKRLIGLPGDTVEIRRGVVFVNGAALSEPYRLGAPHADDNYGPMVVPEHQYFMLGDNRDDSYDSRYWGFVPEHDILGTPVMIYMSVNAPDDAWQPGDIAARFAAYGNALVHPGLVRWNRLFHIF